MADTLTSDNYLSTSLEYTDHETNTDKKIAIKVPNPKANLTEQQIKTAMTTFINADILLTPDGDHFTQTDILSASIINETKLKLDVGWVG